MLPNQNEMGWERYCQQMIVPAGGSRQKEEVVRSSSARTAMNGKCLRVLRQLSESLEAAGERREAYSEGTKGSVIPMKQWKNERKLALP